MGDLGFLLRGLVLGFALRGRFDAGALVWVNRVSGTVICAFGGLALAGLAGPEA